MKSHDILQRALDKRSVFHSEADFQHHMAWEIQAHLNQSAQLRLEYPFPRLESEHIDYCDIMVREEESVTGIELKYKTVRWQGEVEGESFWLKQQGAQDTGRYDFIKDIVRLESWCERGLIQEGVAIFLTNEPSYWEVPKRQITAADREFRLHQEELSGLLTWHTANKGTLQGRTPQLQLKGRYALNWQPAPYEGFRYLMVQVSSSLSFKKE